MRPFRLPFLFLLPLLTAFKACDPPKDETAWYFSCGDPVCQGYTGPFEGVSLCTDEEAGASCDQEGALCDPQDDCNARLICATEDPTTQPGGCPISRRHYKHDIHYLSDAERTALAQKTVQMKIATWNYNWDAPGAPPHLGFIIDDAPGSYAVTADGDHVDLYGYTSLTLATIQAQQAQLEAQNARIARLEAALEALRQKE